MESGHANGTISDADYAKKIYDFYRANYLEDLDGSQKSAKRRLKAAGLPIP